MSVSEQIKRIQDDKDLIKSKLIDFELVESTANLDDCAEAIDGIENRGVVDAEIKEGESFTILAGYHKGGTVTGIKGGGNYSLEPKTVTPTKASLSVTPSNGKYGLSSVTVNPIPDIYLDISGVTAVAGDVLSGKLIIDAAGNETTGTMLNNNAVSQTLSINNTSYTVPAGYHNGAGTVSIETEPKTATPKTTDLTISPSSGKVLSSVTVKAVTVNLPSANLVVAGASATVTSNGTTLGSVSGTYYNGGGTYTLTEVGDKIDMGATSSNRYIKTQGLLKVPTATYTASGAVTSANIETYGKLTIGSGSVNENAGSVSGTTFTQGTVSASAGWVTSGTKVSGATFKNVATSGTTYKDISSTTAAPVLKSGDFLYINKGYTDNVKISLAQLVPDSASVGAAETSANILTGTSAYNNAGKIVAGSMVNNSGTSLSFNALTQTSITVTQGYFDGTSKVNLTDDLEAALAAI